ncbi:ATP-binding protein (plasmid) [Roseomonas sp. OT10]|uniref:ATP-binding protein n=1 Tax=Roseomonas cutis TaxID=2897332 RepID=UPI001E396D12|nr:ATP-binding protein [Roseomonas sp. OT10]UFN51586.1 ATP-binding protein [Roseomonas sp. OT10]
MLNDDIIPGETSGTAPDDSALDWSSDAPRGGRAVMGRILKEKASVPLFFAQTLVQSLRDVGYDHTTSALCEHVDNAIQAGAKEVRVLFRQTGKKGEYRIDAAVYDDGRGMSPSVLKVATSFGGSLNFNNRKGIGRFGMGMKTAALSLSPVMELYSWQEAGAFYNMTLDVEAIGKERANLVQLPDPTLMTELPDEVADLFLKPMSFPSDRSEQQLLAEPGEDLADRLGRSGTIVYMPECDRLTYAKAQTLVDHATKEMARVYRRAIGAGLRLFVNNRRVEASDPTYSMPNARHARLDISPKQSRLILPKQVDIKLHENGSETVPVTVKIFRLPIEEWSKLDRKTQRNDLRIFDGYTVSILRNGREVFAGPMPRLTTRHSVTNWYRIQIDIPGELDEAFGIASNKQGVRMKGYVEDAIKDAIGGEISRINDEIKRFQAEMAAARSPAKPTTSEAKAAEADPFQRTQMASLSPEEEAQLEENLRGLALTLRRDGETDDEAFERVKASPYIIVFRHDEYWPFYDVQQRFGRTILTLNTAHPFFTQLYDPISKMGVAAEAEDTPGGAAPPAEQSGPIVALDLLLLSLARTQGRLAGTGDDAKKVLDLLRREWSDTYRVQMTA